MTLTVGSLFSGIGGFELGFERAGFEVAWQVEIDPWCRRVLAKHWPDVPKYEDVREVGKHNLAPVDVIIGGFPCQDISAAGKGAGIDGERSGLWREYARLIDELRPRYAVMENVGALLYRGLGRVLGDLAEIGYDAEWQILPASAFGAPHRRDRIWIIAYPNRRGLGQQYIHASSEYNTDRDYQELAYATSDGWGAGWSGRPAGISEDGQTEQAVTVAHAQCTGLEGYGRSRETSGTDRQRTPGVFGAGSRPNKHGYWLTEPSVGRVANGVPARVDRLRGLGNAVVPQVAQYVAECVLQHAQATTEAQAA